MNLMHLKYALEVAKYGSINRAAEAMAMGQPNLSRAIRELEGTLGITIFDRTTRGMVPTPDGETFLQYARSILHQIDEVEALYQKGSRRVQKFSISVPRASYIGDAFAAFSRRISTDPAEIFYKETNSSRAIRNILEADYQLGILRYARNYEYYFSSLLQEKSLRWEPIADFSYRLVMSRHHPLAQRETIHYADLENYIEISHADPYVPSLPLSVVKKEELPDTVSRRIFVFERASQYELLSENHDTFMWVTPIPQGHLERYDLVERICPDNTRMYRDVLICRQEYRFTALDEMFIEELNRSRIRYL